MSFIKRVIGPDEKLIGLSTVHWVYGLKGLLLLGALMGGGAIARFYLVRYGLAVPHLQEAMGVIGNYVFWTGAIMGVVIFLIYFIVMISTEIALTTKRVVFKRGLIAVDVREVDLEEIKAADVDNGWFGRFLNYGYLLFDARFVENITLPAIGDPYRFVKALNDIRSRNKEESMRVILDDAPKVRGASQRDRKMGPKPPEPTYEHKHERTHEPAPEIAPEPGGGIGDELPMDNDPRYQGLSNDPMEEVNRMGEDIHYPDMSLAKTQQSAAHKRELSRSQTKTPQVFRSKRVKGRNIKKHLKAAEYNRARLHDKLLDSFSMITKFGARYQE